MIAEDEYLEREALKSIINATKKGIVICEAGHTAQTLALARHLRPDMLFLNYRMAGGDYVKTVGKIKTMLPSVNLVVTSGYLTKAQEIDLIDSGLVSANLFKPYPNVAVENLLDRYSIPKVTLKKLSKQDTPFYPNHLKSPPVIRALAYIQAHYREPLTLELLSKVTFFSPYYLSRLFKKEVGVTLVSYILHKKLEEAQKLLEHTDQSISEVSNFVGFSDQSYFSKAFKKGVGITPAQYREKKQAQKQALEKIVKIYLP